jgi:hypothetical protein
LGAPLAKVMPRSAMAVRSISVQGAFCVSSLSAQLAAS